MLPLNFPAQVHAFLHPICYSKPKIGQNLGFSYIFGFSLVWFGFGFDLSSGPGCLNCNGSDDTSHFSNGLKTPEISRGTNIHSLVLYRYRFKEGNLGVLNHKMLSTYKAYNS